MTGTPLDLTPFGALLQGIGVIYWLLAALGLWLALRGTARWRTKLLRLIPVVLLFGFVPGRMGWEAFQARRHLNMAVTLFQERCKSAGEKISRTVENVDGIVWMKWREPYSNADNFADQFKLNDPYGRDCGAEDCIANLLRVTAGATLNPEEAKRHGAGYRFVETVDPRDGQRYRYTASLEQGWNPEAIDRYKKEKGGDLPSYSYQFKVGRVPIEKYSAGYGVTWDDISTREDREHWIAGGSMKVIDLQSNEVIAERVGYMVDQGQGSQAGFRSPWLYAVQTACPEFPHEPNNSRRGRTLHEIPNFIASALHPTKGE